MSWVELGDSKKAIAISYGGTGQGYSQGYLALFEVARETVRLLVDDLPVMASNEGACLEPPECWSVAAEVRYRLDGNRYQLIGGQNPVPRI